MAEHYYYSIASGSSGNCGLYMADGTAILIDLGVSLRRITTALKALSLTLEDISAVVLTHEHIDHVKGLPMFLKKAKAPVFATRGTAEAFEEKNPEYADRLNVFDSGERFWVRDVDVVPFPTPHDAAESTGYIFEHGGSRFGFATDLGFVPRDAAEAFEEKNPEYADRLNVFDSGERFWVRDVDVVPFPTPHDAAESTGYIFEHGGSRFGFATDLGFVPRDAAELMRGCEMVVLESNHDPHMLQAGPYPYSLKMRVAGPSGHLSNPDCAVFAADLVKSGTRTLVLAHLSEKNNMPELARQQTLSALRGLPACEVLVAPKEHMEHPVSFGEERLCSLSG